MTTTQTISREQLITSEIADFFAGFVEVHTSLGGPNTVEEAQTQLTERVLATLAAMDSEPVAISLTVEHRRVIEMLLSVCGSAFELSDDACEAEIDGEVCLTVPPDAFHKLSDVLDEIEETLPTEDPDRPDVFLAWSAIPRAALKSLLYAAPPAPVAVPDNLIETVKNIWVKGNCRHFMTDAVAAQIIEACRAAMQAEPVSQSYTLPPRVYRELVNQLRDTAVKYQGCQQLREQLSSTLRAVIAPADLEQGV